jgi:predicted nucleic-acid-binding protein
MRAVDTNLLVRLIARDDERQVRVAEEFGSMGAWVSLLVLAETTWVLDTSTTGRRRTSPPPSRCCSTT